MKRCLILLSWIVLALSGCDKSAAELEELRSELGSLTERVVAIENTQIKALEEQISSIEKEVASLKGADKVLSDDVSELKGKMAVVSADLAKLKESVSALDASSEELSRKIDAINAKISEMESKITSILSSIEELKAKVEAADDVKLSYIPKYERVQITRDGLKISGAASFRFTVSPESAAVTIANNWESSLSVISFYTLTKADGGEAVQMSVSGAFVEDGILAITVESDNLCKDFILGNLGATVALKVSCGDIKTVSYYINLFPVIEDEAFITYLLNTYDTDGDGQFDNIDTATELNVSGCGLTSIDDILAQMPALTSLDCSNNNLTSIDLSKNEKLESLDLSGNANLTKVAWKSIDCLLACRYSKLDIQTCVLSDGSKVKIDDSLIATIDGKTWKQFNLGANESNFYGSSYTFDNAQTACPTGWRLPTKDDLSSLRANYSDWTTYLGVKGRWFSGSQTYSPSVSAIFLPELYSGCNCGIYWSSTEYDSSSAYGLGFSSFVGVIHDGRSKVWSVRCLKDESDNNQITN